MPYFLLLLVILFLLSLVVGIVVIIWHRIKTKGGMCPLGGLLTAFLTAGLVFLITYLSSWIALRQEIALGVGDPLYSLRLLARGLADYANKHNRYPDSLEELAKENGSLFYYYSPSGQPEIRDPWGNLCQYQKTEQGYRVYNVGPEGQPGGIELHAGIGNKEDYHIRIEPTFSEFLRGLKHNGTLFGVALGASFCAGLACFLSTGRPEGQKVSRLGLLSSIGVTTVGAVIVALGLTALYLAIGSSGH